MPVRFIIGRAGTGKTHRCFTQIVEAMRADPLGPTILWILPKQATFEAERRLVCESGLGAFTRTRVVSFQTLATDVLNECGGTAVPEVTALGRQMILGQLLRKHVGELTFFKSVATQPGLAGELESTFTELERSGRDASSLSETIESLAESRGKDPDAVPLLAKLKDIQRIYTAYSAFLGQDRLDPHRRSAQVVEAIGCCASVKNSTIYVDGFLDFTSQERQILVGLARVCASLEVALLVDPASPTVSSPHVLPSEMSLFHRVEHTYRRLWFALSEAGVTIDQPVKLTNSRRFSQPALATIEREFETTAATEYTEAPESAVTLIDCASPRDEVDAAARSIKAFMQKGLRLRDISIIVRSLDDYADFITAAFREHDLPFFIDRRRTAAHHPLLQFIRAALHAARTSWPHDAVMTLIKTGLAGMSADEADELENYVVLHRIKGDAWAREQPWTFRRKSMPQSDDPDAPPPVGFVHASRANELRNRVAGPMNPFIARLFEREQMRVQEIVVALFTLLDAFGVPKTLARWMDEASLAGRLEQRAEHEQVWANLVQLFDQMTDLLGDQPLRLSEFCDVLETGLEQFDLALTPPTVDQIVVGQIDRTRTSGVRAAVVLGLAEGKFPRLQLESGIFSNLDRRTLHRQGTDVGPDTQRMLIDEGLLGYLSLTRGSHALVLTRPTTDEAGRPLAASPFWNRVKEILPNAAVRTVDGKTDTLGSIATPRQLVTTLMKWVRSSDPAPLEPLYHWLARHTCCDDSIDTMRYRAWRALSYANSAELSPQTRAVFFAPPLSATVAQLESFANCPFQHFIRFGLGLTTLRDDDVTAGDLGSAYHQILRRVVEEGWLSADTDLDEDALADLIARSTTSVGKELRGELLLSSARNKYLLGRIHRTLTQIVAAHRAAGARGSFKPAFIDVKFGPGQQLPALSVKTHHGHKLELTGRIDRIDVQADSRAALVIDYKLSGASLSLLDIYHGLSLQLLTSMIVLQVHGKTIAQQTLTPAGGFYVQLNRKLKPGDPKKCVGPDDETYDLVVKPRGLFGLQHLTALDDQVAIKFASDVVNAKLTKNGALGWRSTSDAVEPDQLTAILKLAAKKLRDIGDEIISGRIDVKPYRVNDFSPCSRCDFKSVCRHDPAINGYLHLTSKARDEILDELTGGQSE